MSWRYYSDEEIAALLEKARDLGFDLDSRELCNLTIAELDKLVNTRQ